MCIHLTPVLYCVTIVLIEVYLLCLRESVSLRDIGKPTSRAEISSPSSLYFKAVKGANFGSAVKYSIPPNPTHKFQLQTRILFSKTCSPQRSLNFLQSSVVCQHLLKLESTGKLRQKRQSLFHMR